MTKDRTNFAGLQLMLAEKLEDLEYTQLRKILKIAFDGLKVRAVPKKDEYELEWPDDPDDEE